MVKFIFDDLIDSASSYQHSIMDVSCGLCKCKVEIPNGKDIERIYRDDQQFIQTYYQNNYPQVDFKNLWCATSESNYPQAVLKFAADNILSYKREQLYSSLKKDIIYCQFYNSEFVGIKFCVVKSLNEYKVFPILNIPTLNDDIENEMSALSKELKNNSYRAGNYTVN